MRASPGFQRILYSHRAGSSQSRWSADSGRELALTPPGGARPAPPALPATPSAIRGCVLTQLGRGRCLRGRRLRLGVNHFFIVDEQSVVHRADDGQEHKVTGRCAVCNLENGAELGSGMPIAYGSSPPSRGGGTPPIVSRLHRSSPHARGTRRGQRA
jgi:hypothetical protein